MLRHGQLLQIYMDNLCQDMANLYWVMARYWNYTNLCPTLNKNIYEWVMAMWCKVRANVRPDMDKLCKVNGLIWLSDTNTLPLPDVDKNGQIYG